MTLTNFILLVITIGGGNVLLRSNKTASKSLIIGHRGAAALAPENTLKAVRTALGNGVDGIEVDVHLSADGKIMVIHDEWTGRTCNRNLEVAKTQSSELRKLDAGEGEKIPFLNEVVEATPSNKLLFIEIKSSLKTVDALKSLLSQQTQLPKIAIISFDLQVVERAKELMPQYLSYLVFAPKSRKGIRERIKKCQDSGLDGIDIHHRLINKKVVDLCKASELDLYCWTVNRPNRAKKLSALGIKGITTDNPKLLKEALTKD